MTMTTGDVIIVTIVTLGEYQHGAQQQ